MEGCRGDREKRRGGQPLEHPSSPQSQPGTAVFLLAQQPYCPPAVPAPAPEQRGGGIAASPSAALAAPFSPHPGTVQPASGDAVQAAGQRRRMRGEHRPAAGALWQAGWVRRHRNPLLGTCRGVGALGLAASPASLPLPCAGRGGMGCAGKMAAPQRPSSVGARTAGPREQPGSGGRCWDGDLGGGAHQNSSQDQSSPPTPLQGAGGLLDLCQALHQAQPPARAGGTGKPPPGWGTPHLHTGTGAYPNTAWLQPLSEPPATELQAG